MQHIKHNNKIFFVLGHNSWGDERANKKNRKALSGTKHPRILSAISPCAIAWSRYGADTEVTRTWYGAGTDKAASGTITDRVLYLII